MTKVFAAAAVPRHFVFALDDGTFVVQWGETRVQELLTGQYREIKDQEFGHYITDFELDRLKDAGRVEQYNRRYVWLFALPEQNRFGKQYRTQEKTRNRVRAYYINTTLPRSQLDNIQNLLNSFDFGKNLIARERGGLVGVWTTDGLTFETLRDAEDAQKKLVQKAPDIFRNAAVAFVETAQAQVQPKPETKSTDFTTGMMDLKTLIASQTDTSVTAGKRVVVADNDEQEQKAIGDLFTKMQLDFKMTRRASEALNLLEDFSPHMLIMDLQLPDMHGWEMLGKTREMSSLRRLLTIVIADRGASPDSQTFALTVAKVNVFLTRPLSMARLRQDVWTALRNEKSQN